jgi:uncharacterized protein YoxC
MATEDPRRAVVEVIGRLGRETQLHLDERYRHFRITDGVTIVISLMLVILAVFNVYYVRVLYTDFEGIVANMESMHQHLKVVDGDMLVITRQMAAFDGHLTHMEPIEDRMQSIAATLPQIREDMEVITQEMATIQDSMGKVGHGMIVIDQRVHLMTGAVAGMRENVGQFAKPMGGMMPFMP